MTGLHEPLDRYSRASNTLLHTLDARLKLIVAVVAVVIFSFTPLTFWPAPAGVTVSLVHVFGGLLLCVAIVWAGIPVSYALTRLLLILPFIAAIAFSIPLGRNFDPASWTLMAQVIIRGTLSFMTLMVLANTTPAESLVRAMRQLGVPSAMTGTLAFMMRYQALVMDELSRMRRARLARTFDRRGIARWRVTADLAGRALARSFERSQRVHAAMVARGYGANDKR